MIQKGQCLDYDGIHGSRKGTHTCHCSLRMAHGPIHVCPTCKRRWGHPEYKLKPTPTGIVPR